MGTEEVVKPKEQEGMKSKKGLTEGQSEENQAKKARLMNEYAGYNVAQDTTTAIDVLDATSSR